MVAALQRISFVIQARLPQREQLWTRAKRLESDVRPCAPVAFVFVKRWMALPTLSKSSSQEEPLLQSIEGHTKKKRSSLQNHFVTYQIRPFPICENHVGGHISCCPLGKPNGLSGLALVLWEAVVRCS